MNTITCRSLLVVLTAVLLSGCTLLDQQAPINAKVRDVKNLCYAAGSLATEVTLIEKPTARPALETAYTNLDQLVREGKVSGSLLRGIVAALPFKELSEPTAKAVVNSLTVLFDATIGDALNIEAAPLAMAAAAGLRDGMRASLGK
jgi:hypothetical protein